MSLRQVLIVVVLAIVVGLIAAALLCPDAMGQGFPQVRYWTMPGAGTNPPTITQCWTKFVLSHHYDFQRAGLDMGYSQPVCVGIDGPTDPDGKPLYQFNSATPSRWWFGYPEREPEDNNTVCWRPYHLNCDADDEWCHVTVYLDVNSPPRASFTTYHPFWATYYSTGRTNWKFKLEWHRSDCRAAFMPVIMRNAQ